MEVLGGLSVMCNSLIRTPFRRAYLIGFSLFTVKSAGAAYQRLTCLNFVGSKTCKGESWHLGCSWGNCFHKPTLSDPKHYPL